MPWRKWFISISYFNKLLIKHWLPIIVLLGCEECNKLYQNQSNCPVHQVSSIIDLAVQTRARASLPATHLRIMKIKSQESLDNGKWY